MKPSEVLRAARALIETASKPDAHNVLDAVQHACGSLWLEAFRFLQGCCGGSIVDWFVGSDRAQACVLSLFDRAIAAAEARGE